MKSSTARSLANQGPPPKVYVDAARLVRNNYKEWQAPRGSRYIDYNLNHEEKKGDMKVKAFRTTLELKPAEQKLPPEVKAKWLEALRSGKYRQGRMRLCWQDGYCCLGILSKTQGRLIYPADNMVAATDGEHHSTMVLSPINPVYNILNQTVCTCIPINTLLVELNDTTRLSFNEIADVIDFLL